jgi:pantoate kinase
MLYEERLKVLDFAKQVNLWTRPLQGGTGVLGEAGLPILKSLLREPSEQGLCHASYAALQFETGFDRQSIVDALEQLQATGIIRKSVSKGRIRVQVMER